MPDQLQEVKGVIKFYSREKGYGFIGTDKTDYFFTIHCFKGKDVPTVGRQVLFVPSSRSTQHGNRPKVKVCRYDPEINKEELLPDTEFSNPTINESRVQCPHCDKMMVPRIWLVNGKPSKSYCPFCGEMYIDFEEQEPASPLTILAATFLFLVLSAILFFWMC